MSKFKALTLIFATTLLLSGCIVRNQPQASSISEKPVQNNTTVKTSIVVAEKEPGLVVDAGIQKAELASLSDFSPAAFEAAKQSGNLIVLYFYANWCPICKEEMPNLRAAFDELKGKNVTGFIVNFKDSETSAEEQALAKEYNIAYQHTKIFLKDGKQALKAPDSWGKARYIEEITKAI